VWQNRQLLQLRYRSIPPPRYLFFYYQEGNMGYSRLSKDLQDPSWEPKQQDLINILFMLCPNVKAVKTLMPGDEHCNSHHNQVPLSPLPHQLPVANIYFRPIKPLRSIALQIIRSKLQSLTVMPRAGWAGPPKPEILQTVFDIPWMLHGNHVFTLPGLDKLEYLEVSMDMLGLPYNIRFRDADEGPMTEATVISRQRMNGVITKQSVSIAAKVLPLSLVHLRLRSCNQYTFAFLRRICAIPAHKSNFKKIDLFLDTTACEIILKCFGIDTTPRKLFLILTVLEHQGIAVTFYTGKDCKLIDMRQELYHLAALMPCEASIVAQGGRQFSEVKIHAIKRRRGSSLEHRLFLRHALTHFDLFNSPSFDARYWEGVAFFHGFKNTKYDPDNVPTGHSVEVKIRNSAKPMSTRRVKGLFLL
jgi:hypothetical protein